MSSFLFFHLVETFVNVFFPPAHPTEAVKNIIQFLGMQACERSDKVPQGKSSHTLLLSGMYRGGHDSLVRAKLAFSDSNGVTMNLTVRSTDANASEVIALAVG